MLYDNRPLTIMHLKAALKHIHTAIYDHMENVIDSMDDSPESEEQALARMLEVKRLLKIFVMMPPCKTNKLKPAKAGPNLGRVWFADDGKRGGVKAMQITITNVSREFGKAGIITVDLESMPTVALEYIFAYGLKQVLTDAHSSAKTPDEAKALTEKKLAALMRGEVRMQSSRTSDPVLAEAKRLAKAAIEAAMRAKGIKAEAKALAEAVAKIAPNYMEEARKRVDAAAKASTGLDLAALGL